MKKNGIVEIAFSLCIVTLLPYALFGKNKKVSGWLAFLNGMQISLAVVFFEPLFFLPNPFLALFASSSMWKSTRHATRH